MNITKNILKHKTTLLIIPSETYNKTMLDVAKNIGKEGICYVTLNKTFSNLQESFKKQKISLENMTFIDAISKTLKKTPDQTKGCYFVTSPAALTEISLAIPRFLKHNFKWIIFDSLTNLLIYEKNDTVARFVSSLINKINDSNTNIVFYALKVPEHENLIKEVSLFVDQVVDLTKE